METERNKFNKPSQAKGGKDSTKIVLTAAGATAVGAAAAVAANEWNNDVPDKPEPAEPATNENAQEANAEGTAQQQAQQGSNGNSGGQQSQPDHEIHPVDNGQTVGQASVQPSGDAPVQPDNPVVQHDTTPDDVPYDPIDDVDPDLIAQEITAVEIDPNDVDVADMVVIDNIDTIYLEDGSEVPVATVHTEDNGQYLMVDIDDDMTFDMILDMEGNPVAQVDGNLTMSDVLDMYDETGGELAYNAEQIEQELAGSDNPEIDIIDTSDLAAVTPVSDEEFAEDGSDDDDGNDLADADTGNEEMIDEYEG